MSKKVRVPSAKMLESIPSELEARAVELMVEKMLAASCMCSARGRLD